MLFPDYNTVISLVMSILSVMKLLFLLFISGILITITSSCKKQHPATHRTFSNHLAFSVTALQYIRPSLNNYFIYEDSATGTTDSVVITENTLENILCPKHYDTLPVFFSNDVTVTEIDDYYYQSLRLVYTKFVGNTASNWLSLANDDLHSIEEFSLFDPSPDSSIIMEKWDSTFSIPTAYYFGYPFGTASVIPDIVIGQKTYHDVVNFHYEQLPNSSNDPDSLKSADTYWARGIGLIKRTEVTTNTTHSWSLVRKG